LREGQNLPEIRFFTVITLVLRALWNAKFLSAAGVEVASCKFLVSVTGWVKTMPYFKKIVIAGLGLIGGSLGMALCRRGIAEEVYGLEKNQDKLRAAVECGAVHRGSIRLREALEGAEIVILAAPLGENLRLLREIAPYLAEGAVVTDVGSVKGEIARLAGQVLFPPVYFVGGHPMAGSEQQGIGGADPYLFENALYILTPLQDLPAWVLEKMRVLVAGIGARVIVLTPEEHDLAVAALSHLPHLVACALVNSLAALPNKERFLPLAAGGFRDTTRIALSNPLLWQEIFLSNREMLLAALHSFRTQLVSLEEAVRRGAGEEVLSLLHSARELRKSVPVRTKGYLPALFEILLTIPDRPGTLAFVAGVLAKEGINIADIEILRVREGEGGSVRIGFVSGEEQEAAVRALRKAGVQVVKRT
jgi:prephenate dehydrogenase